MELASIFLEKGKTCGEYLKALEEEKQKIQVFQRELPLSLLLVNYAIESCRRQTATEPFLVHREEEPISDGAPSLEEFVPLNLNSRAEEPENGSRKKNDWLKSVQLWTPNPNEESNRSSQEKKSTARFLSFLPQKEDTREEMATAMAMASASPPLQLTASSTSETRGIFDGGNEKRSTSQRKSRRCWSQDLHRRFLEALDQLGGTEVATPKRIREIMREDGLTNDEVKSHLQKYRLHSRRPSHVHQTQGKSCNAQQVVFVPGVWIPGYSP